MFYITHQEYQTIQPLFLTLAALSKDSVILVTIHHILLLLVDTFHVITALVVGDTRVAIVAARLANRVQIAAVMVRIMAIASMATVEEPSATLWRQEKGMLEANPFIVQTMSRDSAQLTVFEKTAGTQTDSLPQHSSSSSHSSLRSVQLLLLLPPSLRRP